jgi:hypothetical protein
MNMHATRFYKCMLFVVHMIRSFGVIVHPYVHRQACSMPARTPLPPKCVWPWSWWVSCGQTCTPLCCLLTSPPNSQRTARQTSSIIKAGGGVRLVLTKTSRKSLSLRAT